MPNSTTPAFSRVNRVPVPRHIHPSHVRSSLHTYESLITANPFVQYFDRQPVPLELLVSDPFFRTDGQRLQSFTVLDKVPMFAGLTKAVEISCVFQTYENGVRCRSDASGVTVRSTYELRRKGEVPPAQNEPEGTGEGEHEWELVEVAHVDCGSLMKPLVKRGFDHAHQEILSNLLDALAKDLMASQKNQGPAVMQR